VLKFKAPFNLSIQPKQVLWRPLDQVEKDALSTLTLIKDSNSLKKRVSVETEKKVIGSYKLDSPNYLMKIFAQKDIELQTLENEIVLELKKNGVSTNPATITIPQKIKGANLWYSCYIFLKHKYNYRATNFDLHNLGMEIAKMHFFLSKYKNEKIQSRALKKNKLIYDRFIEINKDKKNIKFNKQSLKILKSFSKESFNTLNKNAQIIHGDLNLGNVVFLDDDYPVIIDFEDCTETFLNPLFDIAFVIQRFILETNFSEKFSLVKDFLDGYRSIMKISSNRGDLFIVLQLISLRALLILSLYPKEKESFISLEIEKFNYLYENTIKQRHFIETLEDLF